MGKVNNQKNSSEILSEFMATNWWILWVVIGSFGFYMFNTMSSIDRKYDEVLSKFDEVSKGVIMLDYSGRPIYSEKTKLDALNQGFRNAITNSLRFYAIKDWNTLTQNYKNKARNIEELEKSCPDLKEFKENYFSPSAEQGLADFASYEKTLLYLMNNDNLPEKILPTSAATMAYKVDKDEFQIEVDVDVTENVYLLETDRWIDRSNKIKIKATGFFNPSKGTPINPLGIIFTSFKPTYLKKR